MAFLNDCRFIGNLGASPELRTLQNGKVCTFRIAVTKRTTNADGTRHERTEWVTCVAWRKMADVAGRLRKGEAVFVAGELQTRSWDDKNGGGKRYATEIVVSDIQYLQKREGEEREHGEAPARDPYPGDGFQGPGSDPTAADDDLPF